MYAIRSYYVSELASMANDLSLLGEKMKKATEKFRLGNSKGEPESSFESYNFV